MPAVTYILCDVEGTTTDIKFVHKTLFPYAKERLEAFFQSYQEEQEKSAQALSCAFETVVPTLIGFIDRDVKNAELKRVQGLIWSKGYANGDLLGHVYPDVPPAFVRWRTQGKGLGIYSSGSVQAQKLIYTHSIAGDLCVYIQHHFDLAQGYKYEKESYQNIQQSLGIPAQQILFLSDVEVELDAAQATGMQTIRLFRDEFSTTKHEYRRDFQSIFS